MSISDPGPGQSDDPSAVAAFAALGRILDPDEHIDLVVPAVGCTVVLTDRRLAVVRDGAGSRPRSGIASYPIDQDLTVRFGQARRRIVIEHQRRSSSVFIRSGDLGQVVGLIAEVDQRTQPG